MKDELSEYLEKCRECRMNVAAVLIQKNVKTFLRKKKYKRMKQATVKLQSCLRGWRARFGKNFYHYIFISLHISS